MPEPSEPLLSLHGLSAWYLPGQPVLAIDRLAIDAHTVLGLLGTNGAGKTTLINTLVGVHEHSRVDEVRYRGASSALTDERFRTARYAVFTEHSGFAAWSFDAYWRFLSRSYGQPGRPEVVDALVEGFSFGPFRRRPIGALSTGNKKKAFLIAGLALRRPLLILDEPLDGLDFDATEFLYQAVTDYRAHGAVLMSSHIAESFTRCCDALVVLSHGDLRGPYPVTAASDVRSLVRAEEPPCSSPC